MAQIRRLPEDVAAQIKASASISCLNDVVQNLVENSLDAQASKINIKIDYARGSCWVQDDGHGISQADFEESGGLGKAHHTSNLSGSPDRLGTNGLFLSSLAAVCILSITSRQIKSSVSSTLLLHRGQAAVRLIPAPEELSNELTGSGTKVAVHDIFGNMPVRIKQRPADEKGRMVRDKEWSTLCRILVGILLAGGRPISLFLRGTDNGHVLTINSGALLSDVKDSSTAKFDVDLIKSMLRQGLGLDASLSWVRSSARTMTTTIRALISLDPSPDRKSQYICLGPRYMPPGGLCEALYEVINRLFFKSSFGAIEDSPRKTQSELGPKVRQTRGTRKSLDRWPMFMMRIEDQDTASKVSNEDFMTALVDVVASMITGFLAEHNLLLQRSANLRQTSQREPSKVCEPVTIRTKVLSLNRGHDRRADSRRLVKNFREPVADLAGCQINFAVSKPSQMEILTRDDVAFRNRFVSSNNSGPSSSNAITKSLSSTKHQAKPNEGTELSQVAMTTQSFTQDKSRQSLVHGQLHTEDGSRDTAEPALIRSGSVISGQDDYLDWTDPKTKQTLRINARTGCVVSEEGNQRPTTSCSLSLRMLTSDQKTKAIGRISRSSDGIASLKEGSWAQKFLKNWHNPVFENSESQIRSAQVDAPVVQSRFVGHHLCGTSGEEAEDSIQSSALKLSRTALQKSIVISQVDSKFILIKTHDADQEMLVLMDQHASDERIKLERLLQDLCSPPDAATAACISPLGHKSSVDMTLLDPPMFFELQRREHELFRRAAHRFARWGILYDLALSSEDCSTGRSKICRLVVLGLPPCIAQRCNVEPATLIQVLRTEAYQYNEDQNESAAKTRIEAENDWMQRIHSCPQGILDLLNSRACRSAIMFNDYMSLEQCKQLVRDLARCRFPFQCAHGRPSMVPLLALGGDIAEQQHFTTDLQHWLGDEKEEQHIPGYHRD